MVDKNTYRRSKKTLLVYMSPELHRELQECAKREERTMNDVIRQALQKYLRAKAPKQESLKTMGKKPLKTRLKKTRKEG